MSWGVYAADGTDGLQAFKFVKEGKWTEARAVVERSRDPFLAGLYSWMWYQNKPHSEIAFQGLVRFIRAHPDWPGIRTMRIKAEKAMPSRMSSADVIAWFESYPPISSRGLDRYLSALIMKGKTAEAKALIADQWASTGLSRDEQKELYGKYKSFIGRTAHVKRLDAVLFAGQYANARAIARVLGGGYPELAEARIALAEQKKNVNQAIGRVPSGLQNDPGLLYERLRWRRQQGMDSGALEILNRMSSIQKIQNRSAWWHERHILARRMIERREYKKAYTLVAQHTQTSGLPFAQAEWMAGWLALRYLDRAPEAFQHFEGLYHKVKTPVSKARAGYWAGLAAKKMGAEDVAAQWFAVAARHQTVFYGQMAGEELGQEYALPNAAPPVLTKAKKQAFQNRDFIRAFIILTRAGLYNEASRFLQSFIAEDSTPEAYRYAAELASDMGRYHEAVRIAKKATKDGMFLTAQAYPVVTNYLRGVDLEWALVHALIRQESVFDSAAKSPAGAMGLMQLMPGTARDTAKALGIAHQTAWLRDKPSHNIRLGTAYLRQMLSRFGGSYPLAIAAYNAGPARVDEWLKIYGDPRLGQVHMVDWIEMIPIYETRNYVQRVMEGVHVYRLRLRGKNKPVTQLVQAEMSASYYLSLR